MLSGIAILTTFLLFYWRNEIELNNKNKEIEKEREKSERLYLEQREREYANADTIIANCDSELFLGGKEGTTLKKLSENLGKETIDLYNTSETRSNQKSFGLNYQKIDKELMSRDEIKVMDGGKCILEIRGSRPFYSDKFDITKQRIIDYLKLMTKEIWLILRSIWREKVR